VAEQKSEAAGDTTTILAGQGFGISAFDQGWTVDKKRKGLETASGERKSGLIELDLDGSRG